MNPSPIAELERLHAGVLGLLRKGGVSLREASQRLGHYPEYLGRVFSGKAQLRVVELFAILEALRLHPYEFVDVYFPLGDDLIRHVRERARARGEEPTSSADLIRSLRERDAGMRSQAWSERASRLLRDRLRVSGRTQREVSLALGLPPSALGQRLRGNGRLLWAHVFPLLAELGMAPGRFFFELVFPDRTLTEDLRLSQILDDWEQALGSLGQSPQAPPKLPKQRPAESANEEEPGG